MSHSSKHPKHSFIVLAHKDSPYIESCIISLLRQTVKSEVLLSTSTPSPFLGDLARRFGLPILINTKSEGIAADWNFAFQIAQTPLVTLAHQDDIYSPSYTESCLIDAGRENTLMTFTDYIEQVGSATRSNSLLLNIKRAMLIPFFLGKKALTSLKLKKYLLIIGNPICCPSIIYNKNKIGDFYFDPNYKMNLDWEATLRLAEREGDFIYIRKKLLIRRLHSNSETSFAAASRTRQKEDWMIIKRYWPKIFAMLYCRLYFISHKLN